MGKEREKYKDIETAFSNVVRFTEIKKHEEFVNKFINRDQIFGNLIANAGEKEENIKTLRK